MPENEKSIDVAINTIDSQISEHKNSAKKTMIFSFVFTPFILFGGYAAYMYQVLEFGAERYSQQGVTPDFDMTMMYALFAIFVFVFAILMSIYKFHLTEISRSELYRFGLLRIRIAANNASTDGFDSEVRHSLTQDAFIFRTGKDKQVESPIPGHPGADLGALLINKLMDKVDINVQKNNSTNNTADAKN